MSFNELKMSKIGGGDLVYRVGRSFPRPQTEFAAPAPSFNYMNASSLKINQGEAGQK